MNWLNILKYLDDVVDVLKKAGDSIADAMRKDSQNGKRISKDEWQRIISSASAALIVILRAIAEGLGAKIED